MSKKNVPAHFEALLKYALNVERKNFYNFPSRVTVATDNSCSDSLLQIKAVEGHFEIAYFWQM
jgi:hypothetical protein